MKKILTSIVLVISTGTASAADVPQAAPYQKAVSRPPITGRASASVPWVATVLLLGEHRSGGVTFPSIDVVRNELGERLPDAGRRGDVAGE
jgi:hypothetical protein